MRAFLAAFLVFFSSTTMANVINVEFKFTPFVGDPATAETVETVPGTASAYVNNVPIADQEISKREVPVLFKEREISASVWVPMRSIGPVLRKGKNTIRIEFTPTDPVAPYRAQLRWVQVTDQTVTTEDSPGRLSETNQAGEGIDDRKITGRVVFEREFVADFANDLPWHRYPAVTALTDDDRKALAKIVKDRVDAFKPNFAAIFRLLQGKETVDLPEIKKMKCLDKGYKAGIRINASPAEQLDYVITGNPEVVVRGKARELYLPADPKAFERIKQEEVLGCLMMVFSALYPPQLAVARNSSGVWEVVY